MTPSTGTFSAPHPQSVADLQAVDILPNGRAVMRRCRRAVFFREPVANSALMCADVASRARNSDTVREGQDGDNRGRIRNRPPPGGRP